MFFSLVVSLPFLILFSVSIGSVYIPFGDVISVLIGFGEVENGVWVKIIRDIRLTRTLVAIFGGAGLAVAGIVLQVFFRNPLADPYILGISSGASLFAALSIFLGLTFGFASSPFDPYLLFFASFLGAVFVSLLIVSLSSIVGRITTILIIGLMIGYITSALTSVLQYLADIERMRIFIFWILGSFSGAKWPLITPMATAVLAGCIFSFMLAKPLNALLLSDSYAESMGIRVRLVRVAAIGVTALLTSAVTTVTGPIGFLGLAVPYLARLILQTADNRLLIPFSAFLGSIIAVLSDIVARTALSPIELPISAVTAIFGVPIIVALLLRGRGL